MIWTITLWKSIRMRQHPYLTGLGVCVGSLAMFVLNPKNDDLCDSRFEPEPALRCYRLADGPIAHEGFRQRLVVHAIEQFGIDRVVPSLKLQVAVVQKLLVTDALQAS